MLQGKARGGGGCLLFAPTSSRAGTAQCSTMSERCILEHTCRVSRLCTVRLLVLTPAPRKQALLLTIAPSTPFNFPYQLPYCPQPCFSLSPSHPTQWRTLEEARHADGQAAVTAILHSAYRAQLATPACRQRCARRAGGGGLLQPGTRRKQRLACLLPACPMLLQLCRPAALPCPLN